MAAGIKVFTPNGDLQIDDSFQNYRFLGKATIIADTYGGGGFGYGWCSTWWKQVADFSSPGELVAFRREDVEFEPDFTPNRLFGTSGGSSIVQSAAGKIGFSLNPESNYDWGDSRPVFTVYRFGLTSANEKGNHFEVFDSTGKLVFSDGRNYMRVIQGLSGVDTNMPTSPYIPVPTPSGTFTNIYHSPSVKAAVVLMDAPFFWETGIYQSGWQVIHGYAFHPDRVEVRYVGSSWYSEGDPHYWYGFNRYHIVVLDVTGL